MNQDEFETLLASLASQYAEACAEEMAAIAEELRAQQAFSLSETDALNLAYGTGQIAGKNAEQRKVQCNTALLGDPDYMLRSGQLEAAVLARKHSTMFRVGIENESKLWRAWLVASQGRND